MQGSTHNIELGLGWGMERKNKPHWNLGGLGTKILDSCNANTDYAA